MNDQPRTGHIDLLTAYLLWMFLGLFGAHLFYLRQPSRAIIRLVLMLPFVVVVGYVMVTGQRVAYIGLVGLIGPAMLWLCDFAAIKDHADDANDSLEL